MNVCQHQQAWNLFYVLVITGVLQTVLQKEETYSVSHKSNPPKSFCNIFTRGKPM